MIEKACQTDPYALTRRFHVFAGTSPCSTPSSISLAKGFKAPSEFLQYVGIISNSVNNTPSEHTVSFTKK